MIFPRLENFISQGFLGAVGTLCEAYQGERQQKN